MKTLKPFLIRNLLTIIASTIISICFISCYSKPDLYENPAELKIINPMEDKGVGPIKLINISNKVNLTMAENGRILFESKCSACHKINKKVIGPALSGITKRRTPEWIMNMIMNPNQMVKENYHAKQLLMEYISPMANQNLTESETRSILEYFRKIDK